MVKLFHLSLFQCKKEIKKGKTTLCLGGGATKSPATIAKIQKLVYVYEADTIKYIGVFPTVECAKHFKMGKDTLTKYLNSKLPFKGKIFSRVQLD